MTSSAPRRRSAPAVVLATAVLFGAAGFVAARFVESPQEAAARRSGPPPSVLTAPVERRVLADRIVTRGDVVVGRSLDVQLLTSGDGRPVVTGVRVREGSTVRAGEVLLEVAGRPLIALPGRVPAYRDLRPGSSGKDVAQLQRALRAAGLGTDDRRGEFGTGTQAAVRRLYAAAGYPAPTTGNESEVGDADSAVVAARRAAAATVVALRRARAAPPDPSEPQQHTYVVQDARRDLRFAREDLAAAERHRAEVDRSSGAMVPLAEVVFVPRLPATVSAIHVSVGSPADGVALGLDLARPRVRADLDPGRADQLHVGDHASVLAEHADERDCTISTIGPETDDGSGGLARPVSLDCGVLPRAMVGTDVRVTVTADATRQPALVVPLSAATSAADGRTLVIVRSTAGDQRRVPVTPGLSADGYLQVTPEEPGALTEGDRVVIGTGS